MSCDALEPIGASFIVIDTDIKAARVRKYVSLAASGDSTAFNWLVAEYYQRVWRFQLKWVRNRSDAEELTQETFLAAWQRITNFRGDSQFSTWLLGIALNISRNHVSRSPARLESELPDEDKLDSLLESDVDPLRQLELRRILLALDRAIADLTADMREIVLLVRLEGLSLEDTADLLGLPIGTVKSRLSRATAHLASKLKLHR